MSLRSVAIAALLVGVTALSTSSAVTPVEKVISLISDLKNEVKAEGMQERDTYDEYACFCKSQTSEKSRSITAGQDNIDGLSATISDKTATVATKETGESGIAERKQEQEQKTADLATNKANHEKDRAVFEATDADLSKAIKSILNARNAIKASKPVKGALLQEIQKTISLADAMSLIEEPKQKAVVAFLQGGTEDIDDDDPSPSPAPSPDTDDRYDFHSQGILKVLNQLLKQFRANKKEHGDEWAKTDKNYKDKAATINKEMKQNANAIETLEGDVGTLKAEIAKARADLIDAQGLLTDDQAYLKDLTKQCEARANDWDQRAAMRGDELEALSKVLIILRKKVKNADKNVNERALLLQVPTKGQVVPPAAHPAAPSFLQAATAQSHTRSLLEKARDFSAQARRGQMLDLLVKESKRLNSAVLASLAMKLSADPFAKVKELIDTLINRLVQEATNEATKKGFCDDELSKEKNNRDSRLMDVNKLNAALSGLEAQKDALDEEIAELTEATKQLNQNRIQQTKLRAKEKNQNLKTITTARGGLEAVTEALTVLKAFYTQAAKASALVQASPIEEDDPGTGFEGSYQGNQQSSKAILGLLETIKSDFERTVRNTEESESKSAAEFVEFDRTTKADIAGKQTKKALDQEDRKTTKLTIKKKMRDLKSSMGLLDKALMQLEELKPLCIDTGMAYEDRVQARKNEITALTKALCMLDTDKVETECAK
jgi:hypothetical protein